MTHILAYLAGLLTLPVAVLAGHMLKALAEDFGEGADLPVPPWKAIGRLAQKEPPIRGTVRPNGTERA